MAQEPEGSSLHTQQPATGPCPETVESNPHPPKPISLRSILIPSTPWSSQWSLSFGYKNKTNKSTTKAEIMLKSLPQHIYGGAGGTGGIARTHSQLQH
jgi:hypothetical protein